MKKIFHILTLISCICISSCSTDLYDYDELNDRMDIFDERLSELENWCKETNTNINSLKSLVESLIQHDVITAVTPVLNENKVTGYTITFLNAAPITIYHGENGKDGADGEDGKDGQNGTDGEDGKDGQDGTDGRTPLIGVKQDTDGIYYWTLDGNWLIDAQGTKIKAQGEDGADGEDGTDGENGSNGTNGTDGAPGKDGITPLLKIETDGYWYVSYDNGQNWSQLYKAVGEDGVDGAPGKDGEDGDSFFKSINTDDENFVIFKFSDDSELKIPTWKAFEALQTQCTTMNKNLESLQTVVTALGEKDYVTSVVPHINEEGVEIGYIITFSKSGSVVILHGQNGQDGAPGADGAPGQDGYTPAISIAKDTDGIYYWKLDGEWMTDAQGAKIKAQGEKGDKGDDGAAGEAGSSGAAGADGITPQLKIENGYWHVSYDNGETWTQMSDENAVSGNNVFKSVTVNEGNITFVLNDDNETELVVPVYQEIGITFNMKNNVSGIAANEVIYIPYTLTNATDKTKVTVSSDGSYKAEVKDPTKDGGEIVVTAPGMYVDGFVNVHIDSGCGYSSFYVINFYKQEMTFKNGLEYNVKPEGETIAVPLTTNFDYTVSIPTEAQSWVSLADSRVTERDETLTFTFDKNENLYAGRSVSVGIIADNAKEPLYYITFNQASAHYSIDKSRFAAPSGGGEFIANVTSTLGLKVTDYPDWIVPTIELKENETTKYKLTLIVAGNTSGAYRTATVKLVSDDGKQLGKVEVGQLAIEVSEMNKMIIRVSANQANKYTTMLPLNGTVQCEIDWGDGTKSEVVTSPRPIHTYEPKTDVDYYDVKISGVVTKLSINGIPDIYKNSIYAVKQWGNTGLTSMESAFKGCNNLRTIEADKTGAFAKVTDFSSAFQDCIRLETLFPKLFVHASQATTFAYVFNGCTALETVPADLFEGCVNVTDFSYAFSKTKLKEVPELLFSYSPQVTKFEHTFEDIETLTTIPGNLFKENTNVVSFNSAFFRTALTAIPENLFKNCVKVESFSRTFMGCNNLVSVPVGLFKNCPDVESFVELFCYCNNLTTIPVDVFDHNRIVTEFFGIFQYCSNLSGESPYTMIGENKVHLYERIDYPEYFITPTNHSQAFWGCSKLEDYDKIPSDWK